MHGERKVEEFEIEEAARTLIRAEEIKNDPLLLGMAEAELKKKAQAAAKAARVASGAKDALGEPQDFEIAESSPLVDLGVREFG